MKIFQSAVLSRDPEIDFEAATKQYVDSRVSNSVVSGGLFFTNVSPTSTGIVANKGYVPGTVPANKVITEGTTDTNNVTVTLFAEGGGSFYSPTVTITTDPPQAGGPITATLVEDPNDKRAYTATANLTGITADTVVTATSSTNATATLTIYRAVAGPDIDVLVIGALPGTQTQAKQGDVVSIDGRVPNTTTYAEILATQASGGVSSLTVGAADSYSPGYKTITGTFTVGSASGTLGVQARARNALGTYGSTFTSQNTIVLNQTYPTIGSRSIVYPNGQSALKGSETATITASVTNFDTITYTGTNLAVTDPTTYGATKTVTRTGGTYSYGVNNYTITATRTANGATTTASSAVSIADAAPTAAITITGSPARLQSSTAGTNYTVTITANQRLMSAPTLTASSGQWQGSWTGSGTTWTRTLRIYDTDPKGTQAFSDLAATGLAGVVGSTISSGATYTVGGFPTRTITFPAFARYAAIGTTVGDITKVTAAYTGSATLSRRADTNNAFQSFTIVDGDGNYDPNGGFLFLSDADFAGANTSGTLQVDVTEAV